jgi:hypothetical protein
MDAAESFGRLPDESFDRFRAKRVHYQRNALSPRLPSDLRSRLAQRRFRSSADRNVATLAGQLPGYRLSHAAAAAGDDRLFALKLKIHMLFS